MKIKSGLLLLIVLFFSGCGIYDDYSPTEKETDQPVSRWLSLNLTGNTDPGSRATVPEYENGSEKEHDIKSIRLYFFDSTGKSVTVSNEGKNYIDVTDFSVSESPVPNTEATVSLSLQLNFTTSSYPVSVVAIVNPTSNINKTGITSLSDLQEIAEDFSHTEDIGFVMSNSVYKDNSAKVCGALISADKLKSTPDEAASNPVTIHVERTVAKVSMEIAESVGKKILNSGETIYSTQAVDSEENNIYVKLLGWNVTAVSDKSRLLKNINEEWDDNLFGTELWNHPSDHRSFWAINAPDIKYLYGPFTGQSSGETTFNAADYIKYFESSLYNSKANYTYVNENAAKGNSGENADVSTKVIVAAQLVDGEGEKIDYAEYAGQKYTKEGMLNHIAEVCHYYRKDESKPGEYVHLAADDLKFTVTADKRAPSYLVSVELADPDSEWFVIQGEEGEKVAEKIDNETISRLLGELCVTNSAKVWENGFTYFYANIRHSGGEGTGQFGVVRNTHYKMTITGIKGIGNPVYDPERIIIPETSQETYLNIKVEVMDWRLLKQSLDIAW